MAIQKVWIKCYILYGDWVENMILGQRWTLMTQCFNMLKLMRLLWIVWEQGYKLSFYSAPERVGFVKLSFWIKELWICGKGKKKKNQYNYW